MNDENRILLWLVPLTLVILYFVVFRNVYAILSPATVLAAWGWYKWNGDR